MRSTRHPLKLAVRTRVVAQLNQTVADLADLHARVKTAHWNLRSPAFIALHKVLDEFAEALLGHIDMAAERAGALGGLVEGRLREMARASRLKPDSSPESKSGPRDWIRDLAEAHAKCSGRLHAAVAAVQDRDDYATADVLTEILRGVDQQLWIMEAHLDTRGG